MTRQPPAANEPTPVEPPGSPGRADPTAVLLDIWREVLKDGALGPRDDFFAAGGDSVHAALIVSRIHRRLGVRVPLRSVLSDAATVEDLARLVMRAPREG